SDSLDCLVIQGVQLLEKLNLIRNMGFREDSILAKANEAVSDVDLNTMLSVGEPHLLAAQKELYSALDGKTKFKELAANLKLSRSSWIEILSHLFKCKLVTTDSSSKTLISGKHSLVPKAMDSAAIQSVMMSLRRPDTGMFNYPAFLYFLEQEYFRGHRAGTPVTVIIFEMRVKTGIKDVIREPLPTSALNQAVVRITSAKRHNDLLAHYEGFDYALLCPDTDTEGALIFCERLVKSLSKDPLSPTVKPESLSLSFGIACVPEDFMELGLMLSAAECARTYAVDSNKPVVAFRDMI
ncbi:MAG TPA: diguanylate cyclase, partial [Candidatus Melainabacteria bacterium]|nr:diguanylate cyclase [Candidatus Melainabacteria bacterium]